MFCNPPNGLYSVHESVKRLLQVHHSPTDLRSVLMSRRRKEKRILLIVQQASTGCNLTDLISHESIWNYLCVRLRNRKNGPPLHPFDFWVSLWAAEAAEGVVQLGCWGGGLEAHLKRSAPQWGQNTASKSDSPSDLSRMGSVCAGEGFYQRQTLTGSPVWDCPSNSCVPQEALHKKQPKRRPKDISCATRREHLRSTERVFGFQLKKRRAEF